MSDSVRPHRRQPTRLPRTWDSPGKNTGVGCHFLLQCMKVKSQSEVTQSCPTPRDPMDCSPPGSSTQGIFQARVLEWGAIAFSDGMPYSPLFHSLYYTSPLLMKEATLQQRKCSNGLIPMELTSLTTYPFSQKQRFQPESGTTY